MSSTKDCYIFIVVELGTMCSNSLGKGTVSPLAAHVISLVIKIQLPVINTDLTGHFASLGYLIVTNDIGVFFFSAFS